MIRIGDHIFSEESITYITKEDDTHILVIAYGEDVFVEVIDSSKELDRLEQLLCAPAPNYGGIDLDDFTSEEQDAMSAAIAKGHGYLARDADGQVYAYREEPHREGAYWYTRTDDMATSEQIHLAFDGLRSDKVLDLVEGRYI